MKVIVPKVVDASTLVNSNIPEPDQDAGEVEYVPVDQGGGTIGDSFNYGPHLKGAGKVVGFCFDNSGGRYVAQCESIESITRILIHKFDSSNSYVGYFRTNDTYFSNLGVSMDVDVDLDTASPTDIFICAYYDAYNLTVDAYYHAEFNGSTATRDGRGITLNDYLSGALGVISYSHSRHTTGEHQDNLIYYKAGSEFRCMVVRRGTIENAKSLVSDNILGAVTGDVRSCSMEVRSGKYLIFSRNAAGNTTYIQEYNSSFSSRTKISTVDRLTAKTQFGTYTGSEYYIGTSSDTSYSEFTGYKIKANYQYGEVDPGDPVPAGSVFIKTSSHKKYQAVVDTLLDPLEGLLTVPPQWVELGPTNKYSAFDGVIGNTSSYKKQITYDIKPSGIYNAVSGFNITGVSKVNVAITSDQGSVVYDEDIAMSDNSQVVNWYAYYFTPIIKKAQFTVTDLPTYGGSTVKVTFTGDSSVSVGEFVVGSQIYLGVTQYGVSIQGLDFSRKSRDEFGNFEIIRRGTSRLVDYDLKIDRGMVGYVARQLDQISTTPCVWVGSNEFTDETTVYGYYKDYLITIDAPSICSATISVEGLV